VKNIKTSLLQKLLDDDLTPNPRPFEWCCKCANIQMMKKLCV